MSTYSLKTMYGILSSPTSRAYTDIHCKHTHTLTRSVFLAPSVLLMMIVFGPPMEQMFFSRAPPQTGTVDTAKSCTDGWLKGLINTLSPLNETHPLV